MATSGYVYVLINPSMEGLVKIGKTSREPNDRAKELSAVTGVPTSFILVFDAYFGDCSKAEEYVHTLLEQKNHRVSTNREFFRVSVSEAVKAILEAQNFFGVQNEAINGENPVLEQTSKGEVWSEALEIAESYYFGLGNYFQNNVEALKFYKQAAILGSPSACHRLGCILGGIDGNCEGLHDDQQAIKYFQEGASRGLGECYAEMTAIFVRKNQISNAHKSWDRYFESSSFKNTSHNRGLYGGIYLDQMKYSGLPLHHIDLISEIRGEIANEAKKRLNDDRKIQKSTRQSEAALRYTRYILYPELERETERGWVKWFNSDKGYGFIHRNNGDKIFLHRSEIIDKNRNIQTGDHVEFEISETSLDLCAFNVKLL